MRRALCCAALLLTGCASGHPDAPSASDIPPSQCSRCTVQLENRLPYKLIIFDSRGAKGVGELKPLGRVDAMTTATIYASGRPSLGLSAVKDEGQRLTAKGSFPCHPKAVPPDSTFTYHFICGR
jgi:hypothetical protein